MNSITFKLTDDNNNTYVCNSTDEIPRLILTDSLILKICQKVEIEKLQHLSITLGVYNTAVSIQEYTLTDTIYFSSYYNIKSHISIFQSAGTNVHIVGQSIEHLQVDCKKTIVAECTIGKFELGLFEQHKRLEQNDFSDFFIADNLDLRDSTIRTLDVYAECQCINIQGCSINEFNNNGSLCKEYNSKVNTLHLWQNTDIRKLSLSNKIETLKLEDATLSRLLARSRVSIDKVDISDSVIEEIYGFTKDDFTNLTYESWTWIGKSAYNARDLQMSTEANYQIAKLQYKAEKSIDKFISNLFDFCAGYGYKPLRIIRATGLIALFNTIIFSLVNIVNALVDKGSIPLNENTLYKGTSMIWSNFQKAVAIYAGQIDFSIKDGFPYWLSVIEYLAGVILLAMFVNALYVRYKE